MQHKSAFVIDIHFDSLADLKKGFCRVDEIISDTESLIEFEIKLHWNTHNKTSAAVTECQTFVRDFNHRKGPVSIILRTPMCLGEAEAFATFPNCESCVFHQCHWCLWPRQMHGNSGLAGQMEFKPELLPALTLEDFRSSNPATWFYPQRQQIRLAAMQLQKSRSVIDFGSGSGFVSYLLHKEIPEIEYLGVDPYITPPFQNKNFRFTTSLPEKLPDSWALVSSLADFRVPIQACFNRRSLPRDIIFFRFPDVFGNPGSRLKLRIRNGELEKVEEQALFAMQDLEALGYKKIHQDAVPSHFFDNAEFLIFSRVDQKLDVHCENSGNYSWENSSEFKKSTMSVLDLS